MKEVKSENSYEKLLAEVESNLQEEMRQMYRFASFGQEGVTLLHDTANYISALKLEIEDLHGQLPEYKISNLQKIINQLDKLIEETRADLDKGQRRQYFNPVKLIKETIIYLSPKAINSNVSIDFQPPAVAWKIYGNPAGFSQIISIILSNAINAYGTARPERLIVKKQRVKISILRSQKYLSIIISDWGKGISLKQRRNLFKITRSVSASGLGIGLYIAKQIINMDFEGTISLSPSIDRSEFMIKLPLSDKDK